MKQTVVITILILVALGMLGVVWYYYHKSRINAQKGIIAMRTQQRQRKIEQEIRSHGGPRGRGNQKDVPSKSQNQSQPGQTKKTQTSQAPKPTPNKPKSDQPDDSQQKSDFDTQSREPSPKASSNVEQQVENAMNAVDDEWASAAKTTATEPTGASGGDSNNPSGDSGENQTSGGWQASDGFAEGDKSNDNWGGLEKAGAGQRW